MRPLRVSKSKSPTKVQQTPSNRLTDNILHQINSVMSNIKFSFFLKSRKNKVNQHPIVLSITMDKDRTQLFSGVWVESKKWNEKTKKIKGNDEETQSLNDTLVSPSPNVVRSPTNYFYRVNHSIPIPLKKNSRTDSLITKVWWKVLSCFWIG